MGCSCRIRIFSPSRIQKCSGSGSVTLLLVGRKLPTSSKCKFQVLSKKFLCCSCLPDPHHLNADLKNLVTKLVSFFREITCVAKHLTKFCRVCLPVVMKEEDNDRPNLLGAPALLGRPALPPPPGAEDNNLVSFRDRPVLPPPPTAEDNDLASFRGRPALPHPPAAEDNDLASFQGRLALPPPPPAAEDNDLASLRDRPVPPPPPPAGDNDLASFRGRPALPPPPPATEDNDLVIFDESAFLPLPDNPPPILPPPPSFGDHVEDQNR
jgi:hypothetical protein